MPATPPVKDEELQDTVAPTNADKLSRRPTQGGRATEFLGKRLQTAHRLDAAPEEANAPGRAIRLRIEAPQ
eukprot:11030019-Lingulodinium_polyedra.AAC.1